MMKTRTLQSIILSLLLILPVLVSAQAPGGQIIRREPAKIKPSKPVKQVKPTSPATGTLSITSTPSGAAVKINGTFKGETPLTLESQKPGSYSVTFSAEGYESQTQSVSVTAGKTVTCSTTLKKKQASQPVVQQQEQKPAPKQENGDGGGAVKETTPKLDLDGTAVTLNQLNSAKKKNDQNYKNNHARIDALISTIKNLQQGIKPTTTGLSKAQAEAINVNYNRRGANNTNLSPNFFVMFQTRFRNIQSIDQFKTEVNNLEKKLGGFQE